jgi:hypothetical protein
MLSILLLLLATINYGPLVYRAEATKTPTVFVWYDTKHKTEPFPTLKRMGW